jgi:hypothetical protein
MTKTDDLRVILLADSNRAGKTTIAREFLTKEAGCRIFVINQEQLQLAHGSEVLMVQRRLQMLAASERRRQREMPIATSA